LKGLEKDVISKVKDLEDNAKAMNNDIITTISDAYLECVFFQKDLLLTMQGCKKPDDLKFLMKPIQEASEKCKAVKNKDPKLGNHV